MPKQVQNVKERKVCSEYDISCIIGAITRRGVSDKELAAYLFENYYDFAKRNDLLGRTALHMAASCGRSKLCQWLVNVAGARLNARDWESGYTALQRSLFHGHIHTAVRIMQMDADIHLLDNEGLTAIDLITKDRPKEVTLSDELPCQVYIWGMNDNYTLGTGTNKSRKSPELLEHFRKTCISIRQVLMNEFHTVFLTSYNDVWLCGHGQGGRLGLGTEKHVLTPKRLNTNGEPCSMVSIAVNHSLVLLSCGTVLAFGQNEFSQLGIGGSLKESLTPRSVHLAKHLSIEGVCAAKYHSVFYNFKCILTCGLNGGQLGQPFNDKTPYVKIPTPASINLKSGSVITHVVTSIACIVFSLNTGDIYTIHQFQCRKIASRQLDIKQLAVIGGNFRSKLVKEANEPLKVALLTSGGVVLIWQDCSPHLIRCMFRLSRLISINSIFLNDKQLLFTTKEGEAFHGTIGQIEKQTVNILSQENKSGFHKFLEKSECYHISTKRIQNVYRALSITSDPKGKNFAVIQVHPHAALTEIPVHTPANMVAQLSELLAETTLMDTVHDVVFKVQGESFPAHRYIVSSTESALLTVETLHDKTVVIDDISPEIFNQILTYCYTGRCDLTEPGRCLLGFKCDPVKLMIDACHKYKITSLYKKVVCFRYEDGVIRLKEKFDCGVSQTPKFSREKFPEYYDVEVCADDGKLFKAHKCILAARLDYFHNMLMGGWLESERTSVLHLHCSGKVLETFLEFLYTNEIPSTLETEDQDHLIRLLILSDQLLFSSLKEACEWALVRKFEYLNLKNAANMLNLAILHNAHQFKKCVFQFICLNLNAVVESSLKTTFIQYLPILKTLTDVISPHIESSHLRLGLLIRLLSPSIIPVRSANGLVLISSGILETLDDDTLLELSEYYRRFNSLHYDKRVITPYMEFNIPEEAILSSSEISWPAYVEELKCNDGSKENSIKKSMCALTKKKTAKKGTSVPEPENRRDPNTSPNDIPSCNSESVYKNSSLTCNSPPETNLFDIGSFPSLDTAYVTHHSNKVHRKSSQEIRKVFPPKLSQKQKKKLSLEFDENSGSKESTDKVTTPKAWTALSPFDNQNADVLFNCSPPSATSFIEIIENEKREKNNLVKMKAKPFSLTQLEDQAMEELADFYNILNVFDERISVERVIPLNVAKPTWISSYKKLF